MPELPEVENVVRELKKRLPLELNDILGSIPKLRFPIPWEDLKNLRGQVLVQVSRRAKYLVFEFNSGEYILNHLGMTGRWILEDQKNFQSKHQHVHFVFKNRVTWTYVDQRRFGFIFYFKNLQDLKSSQFLRGLGYEPLELSSAQFEDIMRQAAESNQAIKQWLMNQKYLVGIGNIYASEICFKAGISPLQKTRKVNVEAWKQIIQETQKILNKSIESGGSTIRDYRNAVGVAGNFQNSLAVYGRADQKCVNCENTIKSKILSGRSTFWCPSCQNLKKNIS